ncbi:aconitase family protein [Bradyrhizobium sp. 14AA]
MQLTSAEKILSRVCGRTVRAGEIHYPVPELVTVHDWYANNCAQGLDEFGVERLFDPSIVLVSTDHEPVATSLHATMRQKAVRDFVRRFKIGRFYDVGRSGLGHVFPIELGIVKPGMFVQGYDTHLTTFGAIGVLGIPVLNEIVEVLACGSVWTSIPETLQIEVCGTLSPGVTVRDAAQWLIGHVPADLMDDAVVEFIGPGVAALTVDQRCTLVNTPTELGSRSAYIAPDARVFAYLAERNLDQGDQVSSDDGAKVRERIVLNLDSLEPQIGCPPRPDLVKPVSEIAGRAIQHAYIGSCASGYLDDLRAVARILDGKKLHPDVRMFITPVTQRVAQAAAQEGLYDIYLAAGAVVTAAGCGVCAGGRVGGVGDGEVSIGTGTRNDPGRLGGMTAELYIASPATVAASALAGRIVDPRGL